MKEKMLNTRKLFFSGISITCSILLFTGCGTPNTPNSSNTTDNGNSSASSTNSSNSTKFAQQEPAGLKFNKVSAQNAALLNNQGSTTNAAVQPQATGAVAATSRASTTNSTPAFSAPQTPIGPPPMLGNAGTTSSDVASSSRLAYPGYFPSPGLFEEYVMIDYQEAKTDGYTGTYLDTYNKKVKPVIAAWSTDARHTSSNGSANDVGLNQAPNNTPLPNEPNYYSPYQWQYTFASASKKEVYSIFVSAKETLVLRQKWIIKDLNPDEIKIDSNAAIKLYTDKIADKSAKSPDNQDQYQYNNTPNSEVLYTIPEKGTWYFYLSQEKEGLVWNINFNLYNNYYGGPVPLAALDVARTTTAPGTPTSAGSAPAPSFSPPQPVDRIYYSGGYARINARTGEVLSFNRPVKYTEKYYPYPVYTKCDQQGNCYSDGSSGSGGTVVGVATGAPVSSSVALPPTAPSSQPVPQ